MSRKQAFQHKLPAGLAQLIESGYWPVNHPGRRSRAVALGQKAARALSPNDDRIELMPAPFDTIADEVKSGNTFWTIGVSNPSQIDYSLALIIADFGIGSDSPIILYYAALHSPSVMFLQWSGAGDTEIRHNWVETHKSFEDFANAIGIGAS